MNTSLRPLAWILAASAILAVGGPAAAEIRVHVNNQPVRFDRVQPQSVDGRVLIPLRAVSESLGAEVTWDARTQTVYGRKGARSFTLPIGANTATVNGSPVTLDVPAAVRFGTTLVPLRFAAEALGAEVEWDASRQLVLVTEGAGSGTPGAGRITGDVISVRSEAPPSITVRVAGIRQTYSVNPDTVILRGRTGERAVRVELGEVKPGDKATLRVDAGAGSVDVVEATASGAPAPTPTPTPTPTVTAPTITSPTTEIAPDEPLVISGTATPGTRLQVRVTYSGRKSGGLTVSGPVGRQEVTAGRGGRWRTAAFASRLPTDAQRLRYNISVVALDADGTPAEPITSTVRIQ